TTNTRNWRMSWNADAVAAFSGASRAGVYVDMVHTPHPAKAPIRVVRSAPGQPERQSAPAPQFTHPYTVFNLYAQNTSLNTLNYFGLGNNSTLAGGSVF